MTQYKVTASVTSPPTNISLKINGTHIAMARDGTAAWAGSTTLTLPDSFPINFRAVGIASAPWTLEIIFTTLPAPGTVASDYKHTDKIPNDLLSIFTDTINLKKPVPTL